MSALIALRHNHKEAARSEQPLLCLVSPSTRLWLTRRRPPRAAATSSGVSARTGDGSAEIAYAARARTCAVPRPARAIWSGHAHVALPAIAGPGKRRIARPHAAIGGPVHVPAEEQAPPAHEPL